MTEEAREAAWQDAHDAWTLESGEPMSRDDERLSDSFFAAGVAEGIRQAREAVELLYKASATDYALVGAGIQQSLDAIDALESEK